MKLEFQGSGDPACRWCSPPVVRVRSYQDIDGEEHQVHRAGCNAGALIHFFIIVYVLFSEYSVVSSFYCFVLLEGLVEVIN